MPDDPVGRRASEKQLERRRFMRKNNIDTARWILADSKKAAKRKGLEHNLTYEDISRLASGPCSYCGESEIRMTLDRVDNEGGYTEGNVRAACIRCNYTRRHMPYEAWLEVAKGMRRARRAGLFGSWTGRIR